MAQRASDGTAKKGGLFDDLSMAQVIAGALAAVTSMLLASQIGIYGSVIGVGVGSVVSAVASQLYKKFLQRSADKLRDFAPGETLSMTKTEAEKDGDEGGAASNEDAGKTSVLPADGRTAVLKTAPVEVGRTPRLDDAAQEGDVTARRALAQRDHKKRVKRGVLIVSIVSALAAVAVSAVVIYAVSAGQGVGVKTEPIISTPRSQPSNDSGTTDSSADKGSSSNSSDSKDNATSDSSKDTGKDQGDQSGSNADGSGSNSGSGSGSGSTSGDGSGSSGSGSGSGSDSGSGSGSGSGDTSDGGSGGTGGNLSDGGSTGSGSGSGSSSGSGSTSASGTSANTSSGTGTAGTAGTAAATAATAAATS